MKNGGREAENMNDLFVTRVRLTSHTVTYANAFCLNKVAMI